MVKLRDDLNKPKKIRGCSNTSARVNKISKLAHSQQIVWSQNSQDKWEFNLRIWLVKDRARNAAYGKTEEIMETMGGRKDVAWALKAGRLAWKRRETRMSTPAASAATG